MPSAVVPGASRDVKGASVPRDAHVDGRRERCFYRPGARSQLAVRVDPDRQAMHLRDQPALLAQFATSAGARALLRSPSSSPCRDARTVCAQCVICGAQWGMRARVTSDSARYRIGLGAGSGRSGCPVAAPEAGLVSPLSRRTPSLVLASGRIFAVEGPRGGAGLAVPSRTGACHNHGDTTCHSR